MTFPSIHRPLAGALVAAFVAFAVFAVAGLARGQQPAAPATGSPTTLPSPALGTLATFAPAGYLGSTSCSGCHQAESRLWAASDHAKAMAPAEPATVLGDFSDQTAQAGGSKGRFFKEGDGFFVETEGRDGKPATFRVSHTFGWTPLQQYLVTFPDGRLQALPWAWDTRAREAGGQRWFHVYGDEPIPNTDSRHWTRGQQTWNFMCAECHSTALSKGYDPKADTYRTTWSEISVGCESCHGPGAAHVAWAKAGADAGQAGKGFSGRPAARAPVTWTPDPRTGSPSASAPRPAGDEVELCARCHSRRAQVSADWHPGRPLGDTHLPSFLTPELFEDDGQMKDEVFNDHSFKQSLMYARGVACSDCHDVHSGKLKAASAEVCGQCHLPQRFAAKAHSGHEPGPGAPDCVSCHMPARTYMQVDRRHDHSFRIPRPDLSATLGTPNACTDCHKDKPASWAASAIEAWHGPVRKGHQTWAAAFHGARLGDPAAREGLVALASNRAAPGVARATAVDALGTLPSAEGDLAIGSALSDPDALVRVAALRGQERQPLAIRWQRGKDLLKDPVLIVRLAAASLLADQKPEGLPPAEREALLAAFAEYEASQRLNADRPEGHAALALFRQRQGRQADAEAEYLAALKLEPGAATVSANLADLYRQQGKEAAAEQALRAALMVAPSSALVRHSLGLSLIRSKRYPEALEQLKQAATLEPDNARYAYVYAVALQSTGQGQEAGRVAAEALARHPNDPDLLGLMLQRALQSGDVAAAAPLAQRLSALRPDDAQLARLAAQLRGR
ncbi:MAG: tetratricopeptide repeat protein [Alsobacter sp.]